MVEVKDISKLSLSGYLNHTNTDLALNVVKNVENIPNDWKKKGSKLEEKNRKSIHL